jgi:hypothetical protein
MEFKVERGEGFEDSTSYVTTAFMTAYYSDMGYSDTASEAIATRGSRWMDARYQARLKGARVWAGQAMQWPREGVGDEDGNTVGSGEVPERWKQAVCEAGRKVSTAMVVDEGKSIRRVKAGSVEVEFATAQAERETLDYIDWLIGPYLEETGRVIRGG